MEPIRNTHATLVDLLDRTLEKGLVINADLIISVAGIPLIGVNLRAALAGMETMIKYGIMQDWDERIRAWELEERKKQKPIMEEGDKALKIFGSYFYKKGIYTTWKPGYFYLTERRLFWQQDREILFEVSLEKIKGIKIRKLKYLTGKEREEVHLLLDNDEVVRIHTLETNLLKEAIEERAKDLGFSLEEKISIPEVLERTEEFLSEGEKLTHQGKMWHLMYLPAPGRTETEVWKPGHLYITNKRICWWYDFDGKILFDYPLGKIGEAKIEKMNFRSSSRNKGVLVITNWDKKKAYFSGKELEEWKKVITSIVSKKKEVLSGRETCPQCGREAPIKELLEKGCESCGWVSPKLKKKIAMRANQ